MLRNAGTSFKNYTESYSRKLDLTKYRFSPPPCYFISSTNYGKKSVPFENLTTIRVWSNDLPGCDLTKRRHIPDDQTKPCIFMPKRLIPHRKKGSRTPLSHRLPTHDHQLGINYDSKLRNTAEHGWLLEVKRLYPVSWSKCRYGPTQGHILIHTLIQVILLHDSLCLHSHSKQIHVSTNFVPSSLSSSLSSRHRQNHLSLSRLAKQKNRNSIHAWAETTSSV